jgi:hypothetical protein
MKIYAQRIYREVHLLVTETTPDHRVDHGRFRAAPPVRFEEREPAGFRSEPTVRIDVEEAQHLLDQLWEMGLRPSAGVSSTGQDAAQKEHISDLREIVRAFIAPRLIVEEP